MTSVRPSQQPIWTGWDIIEPLDLEPSPPHSPGEGSPRESGDEEDASHHGVAFAAVVRPVTPALARILSSVFLQSHARARCRPIAPRSGRASPSSLAMSSFAWAKRWRTRLHTPTFGWSSVGGPSRVGVAISLGRGDAQGDVHEHFSSTLPRRSPHSAKRSRAPDSLQTGPSPANERTTAVE